MALSDTAPQAPSPTVAPERRATPSRIERRSMIVRRPLKAAARPAIGRATSSSANAHGLCSSCMSESHASRSPRGSQGKPPQKPSQRCSRCSAASIICEDQSLSTTTPPSPAQDYARHDHLVLRRLCLMAKRRRRKRPWTITPTAAAPPRYRPDIRREIQEIVLTTNLTPRKMPRVQDATASLACRAWKGCSNPLLATSLRFVPDPGLNSPSQCRAYHPAAKRGSTVARTQWKSFEA